MPYFMSQLPPEVTAFLITGIGTLLAKVLEKKYDSRKRNVTNEELWKESQKENKRLQSENKKLRDELDALKEQYRLDQEADLERADRKISELRDEIRRMKESMEDDK